jgi:opacity protein-like surface antigen
MRTKRGMQDGDGRRTAFLTALIMALSLLLGAPALAQDDDEEESVFARQGGYVFAAVVGGFDAAAENYLEDQPDVYRPNVAPGVGFNARLGWRSSPHFGFELETEYINDFTFSYAQDDIDEDNDPIIVDKKFDTLALTITFNAKVHLLTGRIQPYGIAGAGLLYYQNRDYKDRDERDTKESKSDDTSFALRGGIGLDYYITEQLVANIEGSYVYATSKLNVAESGSSVPLDYLSLGVGLAYRF